MIDLNILKRAILVGVILEAGLVALCHWAPRARHAELFGCMLIAGLVGLLYARDLARGYAAGALGGAAAGAACGVVAVGAASLLGDQPDVYLSYGVVVCTVTGIAGGLFGQMDAWLRAWRASLRR